MLTADAVLLVGEREGCSAELILRYVMQSGVRGEVCATIGRGVGDVTEAEGSGADAFVGFAVLGRAEKPVETNDREVDGDVVGAAVDGVFQVKDVPEAGDDGDVGGVGAGCRVVFVAEVGEEISQYGIVVVGVFGLARIALAQVGDPLAHRQ